MSATGQCSYCLQDVPEGDLVVVDILSVKQAAAGGAPWMYLGAVCSKCRTGDLNGKWRDVKDRMTPGFKILGSGKMVPLTKEQLKEQLEDERARAEGRLRSYHPQPRHALDPNAAIDQFNL